MAGYVLVVSMDHDLTPDLSRLAIRHAWPVLTNVAPIKVLQEILTSHARLTVHHLGPEPRNDILLLRYLKRRHSHVRTLAIARWHTDVLERAARTAGFTCYLPGLEDVALIERTVQDMLDTASATPGQYTNFSSFLHCMSQPGRRAPYPAAHGACEEKLFQPPALSRWRR